MKPIIFNRRCSGGLLAATVPHLRAAQAGRHQNWRDNAHDF